ncbi:zinc finger protein 888-like [Anthonomus grandis grandis]|uniref:zinc finger protein 888-like n=1 Tax=Anthonomus grandis grandis TaxID=2921223 RepID=UPI00216659D1|nr:zinc finger protein 888-like [Anthonomus grandis grandis]
MKPKLKSPDKKSDLNKPLKVSKPKPRSKKSLLNAASPKNATMLDNWIKKEKVGDDESGRITEAVSNNGENVKKPQKVQKNPGTSNKLFLYIKLNKLDLTGSLPNSTKEKQTGSSTTAKKPEENGNIEGKIYVRLKNKHYKCVKCDFTHLKHHGLKTHFDKTHNTNVYKCKLCPFETKQQYYFNTHIKFHAMPDVKCPYCQKMIKQFSYRMHIKVHERNNQTEYKCDYCDYRSYNHANVKRHMITHKDYEELTQYKCDQCHFVTVYKERLKCHKQTHTQEGKWTKCPLCDFSTRYRAHLRRHLLNSHGERNIECPQCPQKFTSELNLKNHMKRKHVDESEKKYYYCEMCPKENQYRTTEKPNLIRHTLVHRTMDEIEVFACHKCPYLGKTRNALKVHLINAHLPEMHTHKCSICGYSTITKSRYQLHVREVHGKPIKFQRKNNVNNNSGETGEEAKV